MIETKIVNDASEAREEDIVYDMDEALSLVKEFLKKTVNHTKAFHKMSKKMKGRDPKGQTKIICKFSKDNLYKPFKFYFADKFFKFNELEYLEDEDMHKYIVGIFISGNSELPNVKDNLDKIIVQTVYEISQRSMDNRTKVQEG